jgi:hypothetical protein
MRIETKSETLSKLEIAVMLQRAGLSEREAMALGKKAADAPMGAGVSPEAFLRHRADEIAQEIAARQERVEALRSVATTLETL